MAKANARIYLLHAVTSNGVTLGGASTLGISSRFKNIVRSSPDGAIGVEEIDRAGLVVTGRLGCTDVTKINELLAAAVAATTFYGRESAAATDAKMTLGNSGILWSGFNFTAGEAEDANVTFDGQVRFGDNEQDLDDVVKTEKAQIAEATTYPTRLWRPGTLKFDPDAVEPSDIEPYPIRQITMSMAAELIDDVLEDEIGTVAVDLVGWGPLRINVIFRDASEAAANYDKGVALIKEGIGTLTATLLGRGGADDKVLTARGIKWQDYDSAHGKGYTDYTVVGEAQWKNGETTYGLDTGTKLFEIAAAA